MTAKMYSGRLHAEEDLARNHEGPQVETALAAWHPGAVDAHELLDRFDEHRLRQRCHRHPVRRILEPFGIGVRAEQIHPAIVALVGLETFENLLRVVQDGAGRIERKIRAGFDARAVPALRLIVADQRHVIAENPAEARVFELCRALLLRCRIGRRLNFEFQTHFLVSRCSHRRWRPPASFGLASSLDPDLHATGLAAKCPTRRITRTCFCGARKSSMFAGMPPDSRTVNIPGGVAATSGPVGPLTASRPQRNDLLFRRDRRRQRNRGRRKTEAR